MTGEAALMRAAHCQRCRAEMGRQGVTCQFCQAEDEVFDPAEGALSGQITTVNQADKRGFLKSTGEVVGAGDGQGRQQPLSAEFVLRMLPRALAHHGGEAWGGAAAAAGHHTEMLEVARPQHGYVSVRKIPDFLQNKGKIRENDP